MNVLTWRSSHLHRSAPYRRRSRLFQLLIPRDKLFFLRHMFVVTMSLERMCSNVFLSTMIVDEHFSTKRAFERSVGWRSGSNKAEFESTSLIPTFRLAFIFFLSLSFLCLWLSSARIPRHDWKNRKKIKFRFRAKIWLFFVPSRAIFSFWHAGPPTIYCTYSIKITTYYATSKLRNCQ